MKLLLLLLSLLLLFLVEFIVKFYNFSSVSVLYKMAEYVQILAGIGNYGTMGGGGGGGGKVDMLVSGAQVLSALGLALMMMTTVEARGVQMIRVEPIMLLAE